MSDLPALRQENASLRQQNESLLKQIVDAGQALRAFAGGEVDAVAREASATPVLLQAAQEQLRRNEGILRAVFDGSLDATLLADDDGHFVDVNPAACELFSLCREELIGRSLVEFSAPGYDAEAEYRAVREHGRRRGMFALQKPDGTQRALEYSAVANVVAGLHLSVLRDVTERMTALATLKQSEAVLRNREALLRIAGQVARLGAWTLSLPDLHLTWSDEVCLIHEVPLGTVPTLEQAVSFYAPEFRAEFQNKVELCVRKGEPFDLEVQIITTSNRRTWVRAIGSVDRDASGTINAIHGAFQDIDDRRKLQEQLQQSQKMEAMGQLAGGVAHDFNNILAVILSYGTFIRDALPEGDERRDDIVEVLKAAERAAGLTRQLLTFTRQQKTEKRPIDLNKSLSQLNKLLVRTLGEHVILSVVPSARPAVVEMDPVQFDQIVLNLAVNARDAMPGGGQLRIALEHDRETTTEPSDPSWVYLRVTDTGTGMDERTQERIFEPFFTTKERGKGTGLGLATCFGIVMDAGGKIHVKSAPGKGTQFTVELPLCGDHPGAPLGESVRVARTGHGETLLLAEDDAALRMVTSRVLRSAGYEVHVAADGTEARYKLDDLGPRLDVLVSDVVMPGCSGYDLAARARLAAPDAVVLLTSGFIEEATQRDPAAHLPILWKPVPPQDLAQAIGEALRARAANAPGPVVDVLRVEDHRAERAALPAPTLHPKRASPDSAPPLLSSGAGAPLRKERVLIVDDDAALADASRRILSDDFDVLVVHTAAAARAALVDRDLDVLVLDIRLPDGNGLDLLRELRGKNSELPVVMTTGALTTEAAAQAIQSRVTEYLPKPFAPERLRRTVRTAVDIGRLARVRTKLLAARFGGDEFVKDLVGTEKRFALALPKIRMVFQPVIRSADGSIYGYEALLRCDQPSLASPLRLLAAAEVLGRVDDVGRVVRARVAEILLLDPDGLEAIFLNVHPSEVRAGLLADPSDPLVSLAHRVILEITERASLEGGPKLDAELSGIRQLGYRLAVDDLGEGYAGLSSLVHLRPDIAKIDMSLVREIHRMPLKRDIVAALVDMARRSGIVVVAEGVETVDERDTLVDLGCDLLQGFLFAKPGAPFPVPRTSFGREEEWR